MKSILLLVVLLFSCKCIKCQNLIGYNSREIKSYMKDYCREMNFENVTNTKFKYLKYSDNSYNQTLLFFLDNDSVCKNVRLICDARVRGEKVKEFDSIYKRIGGNSWHEMKDGKDYLIEIRDEQWSSVITIKPDK